MSIWNDVIKVVGGVAVGAATVAALPEVVVGAAVLETAATVATYAGAGEAIVEGVDKVLPK
jgi:hypothetical protein